MKKNEKWKKREEIYFFHKNICYMALVFKFEELFTINDLPIFILMWKCLV